MKITKKAMMLNNFDFSGNSLFVVVNVIELHFHLIQSELFETLDNNDIRGFTAQVRIAREIGADFNEPYGQETGYKSILQLAIEEEDGALYVEELLKVK